MNPPKEYSREIAGALRFHKIIAYAIGIHAFSMALCWLFVELRIAPGFDLVEGYLRMSFYLSFLFSLMAIIGTLALAMSGIPARLYRTAVLSNVFALVVYGAVTVRVVLFALSFPAQT